MNVFLPADILIPDVESMEKWSVIACDQFSSQPEYWKDVKETVGDAPSSFHLILPEAELENVDENEKIKTINWNMQSYLEQGIFQKYEKSYVYVERTLKNGSIRRGLIGMIDLEAYDYSKNSSSRIRATEKTVTCRIPPRVRIREDAPVELPHVLLLCDDRSDGLMKWLSGKKEEMRKIYNFNLMKEGGHISGWLVSGKLAKDFEKKITSYENISAEMPYAVGDGNHSLATAKVCYENYKKTHSDTENANAPARYAMVELENIHDKALEFSPIHRIVTETDEEALLDELQKTCCAPNGYPVQWYTKERQGVLYLNPNKSRLAVAILQRFLDEYLKNHRGQMDYIHGEEALKNLAEKENAVGFLLPAMEKRELFPYVTESGTLPRKTFSMGHATEKRYYLEARQIP